MGYAIFHGLMFNKYSWTSDARTKHIHVVVIRNYLIFLIETVNINVVIVLQVGPNGVVMVFVRIKSWLFLLHGCEYGSISAWHEWCFKSALLMSISRNLVEARKSVLVRLQFNIS